MADELTTLATFVVSLLLSAFLSRVVLVILQVTGFVDFVNGAVARLGGRWDHGKPVLNPDAECSYLGRCNSSRCPRHGEP